MKFKISWAKSKPALACAASALLLPLFSAAQQTSVRVEPPLQLTVKSGGTIAAKLKVVVEPGFHVNSDKPKSEFVIPLKLTWNNGPLEPVSITYPKPEDIQVGSEQLTVFTGTFNIQTDFKAPEKGRPGTAAMTGKLRYQACNSTMCLRPVTVDVRLPVAIE